MATDLIRYYFGFTGRISRVEFVLLALAPYALATLACLYIDSFFFEPGAPLFVTGVFHLATLWSVLATLTKRQHDLGRSAWWMPFVLLFALLRIALCFTPLSATSSFLDQVRAHPGGAMMTWLFVMVLLAVNAFVTITSFGHRGVAGANRYGEDPLQTGALYASFDRSLL